MQRVIAIAVLMAAACTSGCVTTPTQRTPLVMVDSLLYRGGDDPAWSGVHVPDSAWAPVLLEDVAGTDGIYWLRARIELEPRHIPVGRPVGLQFAGMATVEIFWDGTPLPRSGRVGATPAEESPGPVSVLVHLPDTMATPRVHVLAMRMSSHHRGFDPSTGFWYIVVGDYARLVGLQPAYAVTALISLSGMLIVGLYFLALFAANRRQRAHLLLGLLCLSAAALLVAEAWRPIVGYTYDWHITRLRVVSALTYVVNVLLVASQVALFPLRGRWVVLMVAAALLVVPMLWFHAWDPKQIGMFLIGLLTALLWCGYAAVRRQPGAVFAAIGLAGALAIGWIRPAQFVDHTFFIVLDVLLVGVLLGHAFQVRRTLRERELALLKSARLEAELLRRHLQPHFLLNTLTALSDWVEEDPRVATRLIHALADEFRALSAIADRPLISVREEMRMCRSHIEVMGLRKESEIRLRTEGLDDVASIPPAVFHTLVENAITHGPNGAYLEMRLHHEQDGSERRYVFEAPLGDGIVATSGGEGTGLRYVRSRLQEAYGDKWSLRRTVDGGVYRTEIRVPVGAK